MQFLKQETFKPDLTYDDVFLVPNYSDVGSRTNVGLIPPENTGTTLPIVVANMNAVAGRRMAETIARRGGLTVLPQDIPLDIIASTVQAIKAAHPLYDTPITLGPDDQVQTALSLIHKRAHNAVIVVNDKQQPIGIFTPTEAEGVDLFTRLGDVMNPDVITATEPITPQRAFNLIKKERLSALPITNKQKVLIGVLTAKGAIRSAIYRPALNSQGQLMTAVAIGINNQPALKAKALIKLGVDILVIDTAHGHQSKTIQALKAVRQAVGTGVTIVCGNVATAQATSDLIAAGADIIKVGVGPGAMCTTRVMTGVGRPQFSAVLECAQTAAGAGKHVWADGGIRYPRDVALAIAAGASSVMFGSMWAGTYESAADIMHDKDGRLYKENYGMASRRAVKGRHGKADEFALAQKELFEEGISESKMYINPQLPSAEDILDKIVAGLRSACAYSGATNLGEFSQKAVVGIQTPSGFNEGKAVAESWQI